MATFNDDFQDLKLRGFGTYKIREFEPIESAIRNGYNFIDTAELYKNETLVAEAIRESKLPIYVSTKISFKAIRSGKIKKSFMKRLEIFEGIKLNLILLHQPSDDCKRDWEILCELYEQNREFVEHIGVSNYGIQHLEQLKNCEIQPFCNQIELNPFYNQKKLIDHCNHLGIRIISHTTLTQGLRLSETKLIKLSSKYRVSTARILLKWAKQNGWLTIPKTDILEELQENLQLDFKLSEKDLKLLNNMNEDYQLIKIPQIKVK